MKRGLLKRAICLIVLVYFSIVACVSCGGGVQHLTTPRRGLTKSELQAKLGPPTMTQPRTDGGETWIYKDYFPDEQTTYYIIDKSGVCIDKRIIYND